MAEVWVELKAVQLVDRKAERKVSLMVVVLVKRKVAVHGLSPASRSPFNQLGIFTIPKIWGKFWMIPNIVRKTSFRTLVELDLRGLASRRQYLKAEHFPRLVTDWRCQLLSGLDHRRRKISVLFSHTREGRRGPNTVVLRLLDWPGVITKRKRRRENTIDGKRALYDTLWLRDQLTWSNPTWPRGQGPVLWT